MKVVVIPNMVQAITLLLSAHVAASKNVSASSYLSFINAMQPYIKRLKNRRFSRVTLNLTN